MKLLALMLAILVPLQAHAVVTDLGDLDIPSSRIPTWYPISEPDLSGHTNLDVTTDGATASCTNVNNADTNSDATNVQCFIDYAEAQGGPYILGFPSGDYYLVDNDLIRLKTNVVLQGVGNTSDWVLAGGGGFVSGSCNSVSFFVALGTVGASTPWTGGRSEGDTVLEVTDASIVVSDDWVITQANAGTRYTENGGSPNTPGSVDQFQQQQFKVVSTDTVSSPETITIDRPLRYDYGSSGTNIRKSNPVTGTGIKDFELNWTGTTGASTGHTICFKYATENFLIGVDFARWYASVLIMQRGADRNLIYQNRIRGTFHEAPGSSGYGIRANQGPSDNHMHDNICDLDSNKCMVFQENTNGNMFTYNYGKDCDGQDERAIFFHGDRPEENLIEGNVVNECVIEMDNFYTPQGEYNTFFRNRTETPLLPGDLGEKPRGLQAHQDDTNYSLSLAPNFVLNWGGWFGNLVGCGSSPHGYFEGVCRHFDFSETGHASPNYADPPGWYERNVGFDDDRSHTDCTADSTPHDCCPAVSYPSPGAAVDDCHFGWGLHTSSNTPAENNVDNFDSDTVPGAISSADNPYSLMNDTWNDVNFRPDGWCNEIATWPAVGSDVDYLVSGDETDPTGNEKIPAQRRYDGEACTAWTGGVDGGTGTAGGSLGAGGGFN